MPWPVRIRLRPHTLPKILKREPPCLDKAPSSAPGAGDPADAPGEPQVRPHSHTGTPSSVVGAMGLSPATLGVPRDPRPHQHPFSEDAPPRDPSAPVGMENDPKTRTFCPKLLPRRSRGWEGGVAPEPQRVLHPPRLKASLNAPRCCCSSPKSGGRPGQGRGGRLGRHSWAGCTPR